MITLDQVKDVPFKVKVTETNAFIREVPYNDQAKKPFRLVPDFDKLANHALHNHYCLSFIQCPFQLNFESLIAHFDWCCRYLYFNVEQSVLRMDIFARLEQRRLDKDQLEYLIESLQQYPEAYSYPPDEADDKQKWALLKKANFQKNADFLEIAAVDTQQRSGLLQHLRSLFHKATTLPDRGAQTVSPRVKQRTPAIKNSSSPPVEREASRHNFLKLDDDITPSTGRKVVAFLYELLKPCFRRPYSQETFFDIFHKTDSPVLELVKKGNLDNQSFMILFRELKNNKVLAVSWLVIERKVKVFKNDGTPFSGFSQLSAGKINVKKSNAIKKALQPLFSLVNNNLPTSHKK